MYEWPKDISVKRIVTKKGTLQLHCGMWDWSWCDCYFLGKTTPNLICVASRLPILLLCHCYQHCLCAYQEEGDELAHDADYLSVDANCEDWVPAAEFGETFIPVPARKVRINGAHSHGTFIHVSQTFTHNHNAQKPSCQEVLVGQRGYVQGFTEETFPGFVKIFGGGVFRSAWGCTGKCKTCQ